MGFCTSYIKSPIFIVKDDVAEALQPWSRKWNSPVLSLSINHTLSAFGHDHSKPVQSEAVQALLQGQDLLVMYVTYFVFLQAVESRWCTWCYQQGQHSSWRGWGLGKRLCWFRSSKWQELLSVQVHASTLNYCQFITATYSTCRPSIFSVKDGIV